MKKERKVIQLHQPDNVIEFPAQERKPLIHFRPVEVSDEDMKRRLQQFVIILENAARRVQLEEQQKEVNT